MQVHQLASTSPNAINITQQHVSSQQHNFSSPPPSMTSPGNYFTGDEIGGRLSQLNNVHACSHSQCSASFPTIELLEKHEIINHSSGASSVVS